MKYETFYVTIKYSGNKPYIAIHLVVEYTIQHFCRGARPQQWAGRTKIRKI